jgi:uncharacterized repeat protein (TIGR03803 family)
MDKILPIFGTAALAIAMMAAPAARSAPKEKAIYSFTAGADGAQPQSGVILDAEGNLYGTAQDGAGQGCGGGGCGTVFKLTPKGKETTLHVFTGDDGAFPIATLVADAAGNLYGTAIDGGPLKHCACGVIFEITPDDQFSIVHAFKGGADGAHPVAGLVFDKQGNLYGTTVSGGNDCNGTGEGCGTVFKIKPNGKKIVLYAFNGSDGIAPGSDLLLDASGNIYGTTSNGGVDCDETGQGCGVVFKLTPDGTETVLYAFAGGSNGAYPTGGVIMGDAGTLYGTTNNGGADCDGSGGCGVVYALASDGTETGLHSFAGGNDGNHPRGTLVMDNSGRMYGTAVEGGGENDGGVVFEIKSNGREKIVYAFTGGNDGGGPFAGLTMDGMGELYSTTFTGGLNSFGTVFKLKP